MSSWKPFAVAFALLLSVAGAAAPQEIGRVISADAGASLLRDTQTIRIRSGLGVARGDVIATDRTGQVQVLFGDETRVAVGPNARFVVADVALQPGGTARKFAVSAVEGSFRFITGKSRKSAYAINTPTATMGIRGTVFDFVVHRGQGTDLILFSGEVRMCGRAGGCYRFAGRCQAVRMDTGGTLASVSARREKRDLIARGFTFITDQGQLRPDFRTSVDSCGRDVIARPTAPKAGDREARPEPPRPDPPDPEPEPEPDPDPPGPD